MMMYMMLMQMMIMQMDDVDVDDDVDDDNADDVDDVDNEVDNVDVNDDVDDDKVSEMMRIVNLQADFWKKPFAGAFGKKNVYIFATSLKDRLAPWLVMASGLGPRDLKARGSTFCCK